MSGPANADAKSALRSRILALRDALPAAERARASAAVSTIILGTPAFREAEVVLAYLSFGSEFDTAALVGDVIASGRTLVLPRVVRGSRLLALHAVADPVHDVAPGRWGIREPREERCPAIDPARVDFVLVPGVAFTGRGERLGYGGGYYDRLIPRLDARAALVAAAFSVQICDAVPIEPTDRRVDRVVTERAQYPAAG